MRAIEAYAPAHWACYLINGDMDSISRRDMRAADMFVERVGCGGPVGVTDEHEDESPGFCHGHTVIILCPEAPALGCDMAVFTFLTE